MSKNTEPSGKKTFCMQCKAMTETIIIREAGVWGSWPFKSTLRICRTCAKPKREATLEE